MEVHAAAAASDQVTVDVAEAFWDLVLSEDDWLRDEFDAIIACGCPSRPDRATRPVHPWPVQRPGVRWPPQHVSPLSWADRLPGRDPRQRSPPQATALDDTEAPAAICRREFP